MPAIRKIRIVNFRFNDSSKLIPDEIFCTESAEGKPIDTLLNLDNGGGKSVIVQLLLQPICPKAKVQNRNISDYFQKGTDHAFVLIEWSLDGTSNSLLTGIALAASVTADDENESKNVRFYTFMHDYSKMGDRLDLINLPLTEKADGHVRPKSYDELRKFLQSRRVEYYPADSLRRYHKRLEEYGILHTEWENILVRINAVEGGITKFFEEYKTADRLLDRFIIPGVMPNDTAAAEALEEMFVNYADSYAGQEENLRLQSQIKSFSEKLEGILPFMKNMWNAQDARIQSIRLMADYLFTLEHDIGLESDKQAQLKNVTADLKEKLHRIKVEKASEAVYLAQEDAEKALRQFAKYSLERAEAQDLCDGFAHRVCVLNAAKEYAELFEQKNEEKAFAAQIRELERGTHDSRILSLKYSLYQQALDLKESTHSSLISEKNAADKHSSALGSVRENILRLTNLHNEKNDTLNRARGRRDFLLDEINKGLAEQDLHITVMLDGSYSEEDTADIRLGYEKQLAILNDRLESCQNEETQLETELDSQDTKRTQLYSEQANCDVCLKQCEAELEKYKKAHKAAATVLEHLSIPESRLFSDEPITVLDGILVDLNERLKKTERSAEMLAEQLRCIETGQLHISKTAVSFLQQCGIAYQTGEQYLNFQSQKLRENILAINPLAAYCVVVNSESEQKKLISQTADTWLSAVVPVYTRSEIADMADGKWSESNRFLSAFDKEYFKDVSAYKEIIRQRFDDTREESEYIQKQTAEWKAEREVLKQFTYSADSGEKIEGQISSCRTKLLDIQDRLSLFDKRKAEIKKRTAEIHNIIEKEQNDLRQVQNNQREFERICGIITQCEKLSAQIADIDTECRKLFVQIDKCHKEEKRLEELIQQCDGKIRQLNEELIKYNSLLDELNGTEKTQVLDEDFSAMYAEYRLYLDNYSQDLSRLKNQLQRTQESIRAKEKALRRFHIEPEEYENAVYSDDEYQRAEKQLENAQAEYDERCENYSKAVQYKAKAEGTFEQANVKLEELHAKLLPRSEVGSEFERRIKECKTALDGCEKNMDECKDRLNELEADRAMTARYAKRYDSDIKGYTPKIIDSNWQTDNIQEDIEECIEQLEHCERQTKEYHRRELEPFRNKHSLFTGTLDGILSVIDNRSIAGDKYYTLYERTEGDIKRYRDRTAQLAVQLKDVEDSRKQLVTNCIQRVGRLYENLTILSKKSTVQIGNTKKQMIRIELPDIDPVSDLPAERINQYITEQVTRYLSEQENQTKVRRNYLEIRRLLNCYIGRESIPITVFKIDKNIRNSRYRTWQDALKANSGGEQFVVLFTLIVSVMNYTRGLTSSLNSSSGVLILDNPFGPISSPHLLEPMFRIARHFHIQLICLTHLGTAAVTSFFDMVYQLSFKSQPLSNVEILEAKPKQHMEHAYYLSEQLSLF